MDKPFYFVCFILQCSVMVTLLFSWLSACPCCPLAFAPYLTFNWSGSLMLKLFNMHHFPHYDLLLFFCSTMWPMPCSSAQSIPSTCDSPEPNPDATHKSEELEDRYMPSMSNTSHTLHHVSFTKACHQKGCWINVINVTISFRIDLEDNFRISICSDIQNLAENDDEDDNDKYKNMYVICPYSLLIIYYFIGPPWRESSW